MSSLEELVQKFINNGIGDVDRLQDIISISKNGNALPVPDQEYLKKLLAESRKNNEVIQQKEEPSLKESDSKQETKLTESDLKYEEVEHSSTDSSSEQTTEIELLQKDIHKLQDKNHVVEEHLKNQANQKSGTWGRAFGRGIAGIIIFLFGLGMIFVLYDYLINIDKTLSMFYIIDPYVVMLVFFVIIPGVLVSIGGTAIYYGIRIISKT